MRQPERPHRLAPRRINILPGFVDLPAQGTALLRRQPAVFARVVGLSAGIPLRAVSAAVRDCISAIATSIVFPLRRLGPALLASVQCKTLHLISAYGIHPVAAISAGFSKNVCRSEHQQQGNADLSELHIELKTAFRLCGTGLP